MKKWISLGAIITLVAITFYSSSCKKSNTCTAGSGGSLNLIARLHHNGVLIPNDSLRPDTVWIKYDVSDWSGAPAGFSARFIGSPGEDHVHIPNLRCGNYYLFASGWDHSGPYNVTGKRPYSTEQNSGEIELDIPVSE